MMGTLKAEVSDKGLIEADQRLDFKYALVRPAEGEDNFEAYTPFVKCKDYFNELFWSESLLEAPDVRVYGFKWTPHKEIIPVDKTYIAITMGEGEYKNFMLNGAVLHDIHAMLGFDKYTVTPIECNSKQSHKYTFIYEGPIEVQQYIPILSFITLALRLRVNTLKYDNFKAYLTDWTKPEDNGTNEDARKLLSYQLRDLLLIMRYWKKHLRPVPDIGAKHSFIPTATNNTYNRIHNDTGICALLTRMEYDDGAELRATDDNPNCMYQAARNLLQEDKVEL